MYDPISFRTNVRTDQFLCTRKLNAISFVQYFYLTYWQKDTMRLQIFVQKCHIQQVCVYAVVILCTFCCRRTDVAGINLLNMKFLYEYL